MRKYRNLFYYRKLRGIDLAVLHCSDIEKASIGKLLRADVVRNLFLDCRPDDENALRKKRA